MPYLVHTYFLTCIHLYSVLGNWTGHHLRQRKPKVRNLLIDQPMDYSLQYLIWSVKTTINFITVQILMIRFELCFEFRILVSFFITVTGIRA